MIRIRCPHCRNVLDVAEEVSGQVRPCPSCGKSIRMPEIKPPAPITKPAEEEFVELEILEDDSESVSPGKSPTPKAPAKPPAANDFDAFWKRSEAARNGLKTLQKRELPALDNRKAASLPSDAPDEIEDLGRPLASLGRQTPIGLLNFLFALFFGVGLVACLFVIGLIFVTMKPKGLMIGLPAAGLGLLVFGAATIASFGTKVTNSKQHRFWIFEHGLLCQTKKRFIPARWEDIEEVYEFSKLQDVELRGNYVTMRTKRKFPFIRLQMDGESTEFFVSVALARRFAEFILSKACVARYRHALQQIVEGETVAFGNVEINWHGLQWQDQSWSWSDIKRVAISTEDVESYSMDVKLKVSTEPVSIDLAEVSFPYTVQAICRVLIAERGHLDNLDEPAKPTKPAPPKNPFAI